MKLTDIENLASVPQNELEEAQNLLYRIDDLINNPFLHVKDYLPKSYINYTSELKEAINDELNIRNNI